MRGRRSTRAALLAFALGVTTIGLAVTPASGQAAHHRRVTQFSFGVNLTAHTQPANAGNDSCHFADSHLTGDPCTRMAMISGDVGAVGGHMRAPLSGVITKIRLIANSAGTMSPWVAKITDWTKGDQTGNGQATAHGPVISYQSSVTSGDTYTIQSFPVNIAVTKGEFLGIRAKRTSMLRCTQGSVTQLLFQPPLVVGAAPTANGGTDDCVLLIQALGHT
jgi:hypothetical protein